jgi:hypothetical protein
MGAPTPKGILDQFLLILPKRMYIGRAFPAVGGRNRHLVNGPN